MRENTTTEAAWCEVDGCPSTICGGPHATHAHGIGDVQGRVGEGCPWCEATFEAGKA